MRDDGGRVIGPGRTALTKRKFKLSVWTLVLSLTVLCLSGAAPAGADNCQALHEAAFLDEPHEARTLLAHGTDVNCLDVLGQTPLVTAVNGASIDTFDLLLSAGAKVDVRTEFGQTLLSHTKKKYASFSSRDGATIRSLYGVMIGRLENAGAANE